MAKIIGNITATPNLRPDWEQTDAMKADYIKNKPNLDTYATKQDVSTNYATKQSVSTTLANYATKTELNNYAKTADVEANYTTKLSVSQTLADYAKSADVASTYATIQAVGSNYAAKTELKDYIPTSQKGAASGVATLDASGKVPTSQLPSYVDDVLEYSAKSSFPATGETGKIYVDTATNKTYRWGGSAYVEISASLALGTNDSTAAKGNHTHTVTHKPAGTVSSSFTGTESGHTHSFEDTATTEATASGNRTDIYSITGVGTLPSASLNKGTLPSATFSAGTLPTSSFTAGTLPTLTGSVANQCLTLTFGAGTLPTHSFTQGSLPSLDFDAGTLPALTFDAGTLPTRSSSAISVAKGDHTHSVTVSGTTGETKLTPAGSVSSTFTGTSATLTTSIPQ